MTDAPYRGGHGEPLVLLHGASMSWRAWRPVLAGLEAHHDVLVPTMAGHRGGSPWPVGEPVGVAGIADDVETLMDDDPDLVVRAVLGVTASTTATQHREETPA